MMYVFFFLQLETRSRQRPTACPGQRRRGLSLVEILISIFIVSIGLLGVAALLPIAHHDSKQGTLDDLSALVGKHAWRDFSIRRMNDTKSWDFTDPNGNNPGFESNVIYVLDPLLITFRNDPDIPDEYGPFDNYNNNNPSFRRISLDYLNQLTFKQAADAALDRFTSADDLVFTAAEATQDLPTQLYTSDSDARRRQSYRRFSWLTTLVPDPTGADVYRASFVIFHQRSLVPLGDNEHELENFQLVGSVMSYGGVDAELPTAKNPISALDISRNDWIALAQQTQPALRWFRVMRTAELDERMLDVRLEGPDVNLNEWAQPIAVLMKNVHAVYEKTIQLEHSQ